MPTIQVSWQAYSALTKCQLQENHKITYQLYYPILYPFPFPPFIFSLLFHVEKTGRARMKQHFGKLLQSRKFSTIFSISSSSPHFQAKIPFLLEFPKIDFIQFLSLCIIVSKSYSKVDIHNWFIGRADGRFLSILCRIQEQLPNTPDIHTYSPTQSHSITGDKLFMFLHYLCNIYPLDQWWQTYCNRLPLIKF